MKIEIKQLIAVSVFGLSACANPQTRGPEPAGLKPDLLSEHPDALLRLIDDVAEEGPGGNRHELAIRAARQLEQSNHSSAQTHWRLARAIFYQALAAPQKITEEMTQECLQHGEKALQTELSVQSHLYLALCMGVRAKFAPTEGLSLVKSMLDQAQKAHAFDQSYNHAATSRLLGGIFLKAPAWPASVGDTEMAIEHLRKAVQVAPTWPENKLLLAEAYIEEEETEEAQKLLDEVHAQIQSDESSAWKQHFERQIEKLREELED